MTSGTVNSISLTSTTGAFGFDGDGACDGFYSPNPTSCPVGGITGYEVSKTSALELETNSDPNPSQEHSNKEQHAPRESVHSQVERQQEQGHSMGF